MMKRRTQSRLPIQGNFYPMTSMVYIEDDLFRVTLHSAQSHGVASLHPGRLTDKTKGTGKGYGGDVHSQK